MKEKIGCYYCLGTDNKKVCDTCYKQYLNKMIEAMKGSVVFYYRT